MNWLRRGKTKRRSYPRQVWLLFIGVFINRASVSMIWPFLTVYMVAQLEVPLSTATLLLTLRAVSSIASTALISPLMDRIGRKKVMIASLLGAVLVFMGMAFADSLLAWAILLLGHGAVLPVFNFGVQAMVADLVDEDNRAPAYALLRVIMNAGVAIGPVIGGSLAIIAFELIFLATAAVYALLAILAAVMLRESNPESDPNKTESLAADGYGYMLRDWQFVTFTVVYLFTLMGYTQIFSLLPVYVSSNFGLAENQYSWLLTTNAAMVVFMQYGVTKYTERFSPYAVMVFGSLMYAIGLASVSLGSALPHFIISMVIATLGELLCSPTAMTLVAKMAPQNMRARYLGVLSLGYPVGAGIGPVIGGFLNDTIAPVAIWYGAGAIAALGMVGFFVLMQVQRRRSVALSVPA